MKKGFKSLAALMATITAVSVLASCNKSEYTYPDASWKKGYIATLGGKDVSFADIYKLMEGTKDSSRAYFSTASSILAQIVTPRTDTMITSVDTQMDQQKQNWKSSASTNGTSYKEEMQKTLDSEGVLDEDALRDKKIAALQIEDNKNQYLSESFGTDEDKDYSYRISEDYTKKYVDTMHPYHVSHILVKVDAASGGEGTYNGKISADNATKLGDVVKSLISTTSNFAQTAYHFSDDGSSSSYGDLFAGTGGTALDTSTSYVNEFKLGLYAYETYFNTNSSTSDKVKEALRVPHGNVNQTVADKIGETSFAKGEAYGIPATIALEMAEVYDQTKSDSGYNTVSENKFDIGESLYPRNVLFNNYFNNHALSFIYDDSDEYADRFASELIDMMTSLAKGKTIHDTPINTVKALRTAYANNSDKAAANKTLIAGLAAFKTGLSPELVKDLKKKFDTYEKILRTLGLNSTTGEINEKSTFASSRFATAANVSDNLVAFDYASGAEKNYVKKLDDGKKILYADDNHTQPILVTRAGSGSGDSGYQGIHFIIVNNDPFGTGDDETDKKNNCGKYTYRYYRVNSIDDNKKDSNGNVITAYTSDYSVNPSVVNYLKGNLKDGKGASDATYTERISKVKSTIDGFDSNTDIKIFEANLKKFEEKYTGKKFLSTTDDSSVLGKDASTLIQKYIDVTRNSSETTKEETLDSSWESYVNTTLVYEAMQPQRVIPTSAIGYFQGGFITEEMEETFHVKK